jgi:hypothetical protein
MGLMRVRYHWMVGGEGLQLANPGRSTRTLNFLYSGHWNDLRRTEGIVSEPHRHLARKLQLPLNRLEARLLAQGVQERIGLQARQAPIPQPQRRL